MGATGTGPVPARCAARWLAVALLVGSMVVVSTPSATAGGLRGGAPAQEGEGIVGGTIAVEDWAQLGICNKTGVEPRTPYAKGLNCRLVDIDGVTRRFVVYVPDAVADSEDPVPLVFMFHGTSGDGERVYQTSRWRETADTEGFLAVFPTGAEYRLQGGGKAEKWHDYSLTCVVDTERTPLQDDVAFVDEVLADVIASEEVDEARVYASGFSNGSQLAQRLAVERGDRFAAVASFAGPLEECVGPDGEVVEPIPVAASPIPVWLGVGSRDELFFDDEPEAKAMDDPFFFDIPGFMDLTTRTFGLASDESTTFGIETWPDGPPVPTWPEPTWSVVCWDPVIYLRPVAGNASSSLFVLSVLDGVEHYYPNAKQGAPNPRKSAYVTIAEVYWRFFERLTQTDTSGTATSPCEFLGQGMDGTGI